MTKVAIKNENIASLGGIYHVMDIFSKLGLEKSTESVREKYSNNDKTFNYRSILVSVFFGYFCDG